MCPGITDEQIGQSIQKGVDHLINLFDPKTGTLSRSYSTGDEAPGGDNPTPDQNNVDDIGLALGVEYEDNEELEGAEKIEERDRHRWEHDPESSEDYEDR